MNAVTTTKPQEVAPAEFSASLLEVISSAASNPAVDIDKLERLIALQERMDARAAKAAYTDAKLAMRPELPEITMKGKIVIRDKHDSSVIIQETPFARFEDIHEAVTPILTKHGFDLEFKNGLSPDGKVRVTTILTHKQGHSEDTYFDLPHDSSGSKNSVQAVGSSTSYAKRYGVLSILNLKVSGEDDDANSAIPPVSISVKQYDELLRLITSTQSDQERFVGYLRGAKKIGPKDGLDDLPLEHFEFAKDCLLLKAGKKPEAGK